MFYTIYEITNTINGKIYIGKHQTTNLNDDYYGSGKLIKSAIKKYGKENFKKELLFIFDTEDKMNAKEKEIVTEDFVSRKDTYNTGVGGEGGPHFKGKTHDALTKEIIRENSLGNGNRKGKAPWNKGKTQTQEHNQKIRESRQNTKHSPDTIEKIKESRKNQVFSDETRRKMSESAKNRKITGP